MRTEYEIERENRIRENDAMLESLFGSNPAKNTRPSQDGSIVSPSISEASSSRLTRSSLGQKQLYTAREVDNLLAKEEEERARNLEDKKPPTRYILAVIELPRRSARFAIRRTSRAIKRITWDSSSDGEYRNHRPSKKSNVRRVANERVYDSIQGRVAINVDKKQWTPRYNTRSHAKQNVARGTSFSNIPCVGCIRRTAPLVTTCLISAVS
ncbi:hypothetical protein EDD21DRAFT_372174 [Dissophora ornata]|nr:hypothetical protein EDD21DRAFT_372174 [Dissophora ornata]